MAKQTKRQKLINLHSGGLSTTNAFESSLLEYGEIAIRHHKDEPRMYTKVSDTEYATFVDENAIDSKISTVVDPISSDINALKTWSGAAQGHITSLLADVNDITEEDGLIDTAKKDAITSAATFASAYTDIVKADLQGQIDGHSRDIASAFTESHHLSGAVVEHIASYAQFTGDTNNALKTITGTTIPAAKADAVTSAATFASDYTDAEIAKVQKDVDANSNAIKTLATKAELGVQSGRVDTLVSEVNTIKETTIPNAKADAIASAATFASAYTDAEITKIKNEDISRLNALIGSDTGMTARAIAKAEVQLLVGSAPEALNTLEEIATWIESDSAGTVELVNKVADLEVVANFASAHTVDLEKEFDEHVKTASETYATKVELGVQSGRVDTLVSEVNTIKNTTIPNAKADAVTSAATFASDYTDAEIAKVEAKVDANSKTIATLATKAELGVQSGRVDTLVSQVTTITETTIPAASANAYTTAVASAKSYTDTEIAKVKEVEIAGLDGRIDALEALSGTTGTAVQSASIDNDNINKIVVKKEGTELKYNFDELVIDCGTF